MPEGPEIRQSADRIAAALLNQPTTEVFFAFDRLKLFEAELTGETVVSVKPRGKAMLIRFSNALSIYSHNQLYGVWMIRKAHNYPTTNRQLRLAIHTTRKSALLYSASDISVLTDSDIADHPFLSKLGPDVLDENTTVDTVRDRLQQKQFHRRRFSTLLLDQHCLSGLGNYLRSEILFVSGLHPSQRPIDCSPTQLDTLSGNILIITRQSYETKGITNDLDTALALKSEGYRRRDYRFYVFSRKDKPCRTCGTPIVKETLGGRRCYYCPQCQPA
ncbi:MAG: endonuclease VIII [Cyanobacteria bacterium P01_A01_bin.3]